MNKEENEPQQEVVEDEDDEELEDEEDVEVGLDNSEKYGEQKESKKSMLTFFMIFFPSIILAIIPSTINDSSIVALGIKSCVLLLQLVILKNFVDTYYE